MSSRLLFGGLWLFASMFTMLISIAQEEVPDRNFYIQNYILDVRDYFEERTFQYTAGRYKNEEIKYRLHIPENIRYGRKYPLIVHLHGAGEGGLDNIMSLFHLQTILPVLTGQKSQDFFLLVTQCHPETPGWNFRPATKDGSLDVLMAILEHVIEENPVDRKRLTVTGVSSGGAGVWTLLSGCPDTFAGAVPAASSAPSHIPRLTELKKTKIWAFNNKNDVQVNSDTVRAAMRMVNNSGGSMAFTECDVAFGKDGHNSWVPAMETYNCLRWMLAQKRGSWFSPPPGTIVHDKPRPLLLSLVTHTLPLAIVVILSISLSWGTVCELVSSINQMVRK